MKPSMFFFLGAVKVRKSCFDKQIGGVVYKAIFKVLDNGIPSGMTSTELKHY